MSLAIETRTSNILKNGLSSDYYPTRVEIQVHHITLQDVKPARVELAMRATKKTVSALPYAHVLSCDLNYHSLLFDVLKINVLVQKFVMHERVAQASIRLADLQKFHGDLLFTFPLLDASKKQKPIGEIVLHMVFSFGITHAAELVDSPTSMTFSDFSGVSDRGTMDSLERNVAGLVVSENFKTYRKDKSMIFPKQNLDSASSSETSVSSNETLYQSTSSNLDKIVDSTNETYEDILGAYQDVDNEMNSESASISSVSRSASTLSYRRKTAKQGLDIVSQFYAAFTATGWRISKSDFARGVAMITAYNEAYPTPKTFKVVDDDEFLRIGAYFLPHCIAAYGTIAMQYFGYGQFTDLLKLDQNKKACINLLKIDKKDLLVWEYNSTGLFDHKPSFFISYDKNTNSIIVAIRGTFGVADVLTDLDAEYAPFLGGSAHGGCVHSALWIKEHYGTQIKQFIRDHKAQALYLVGHSLGGSVSALLLMLGLEEWTSEFGKSFEVKSFGYASPPCLSKDLLEEFKPYVYTFINEYDIVPKISYGAIVDFRELVKYASDLSKDSKKTKSQKLESMYKFEQDLLNSGVHPRLYVPGNIYFMYKTNRIDPSQKKDKVKVLTGYHPLIDYHEPHYVTELSDPEHFLNLHVRLDMFLNHFLNKYDNALKKSHDWLIQYKENRK